jgi:hypothetical protein
MSQTITLTLPDNFFHPVQRTAQAIKQPVETLLLTALQASLPSIEELPIEVRQHLIELEVLDDEALRRVMMENVPQNQRKALDQLLARNQTGALTDAEHEELTALQHQADLVMLRKARAAVLLRFRGKRIPTLAELAELNTRRLP